MGKKVLRRVKDGVIFPPMPLMVNLPGFELVDRDELGTAPRKRGRGRPKKVDADKTVLVASSSAELDDLTAGLESGETDDQ